MVCLQPDAGDGGDGKEEHAGIDGEQQGVARAGYRRQAGGYLIGDRTADVGAHCSSARPCQVGESQKAGSLVLGHEGGAHGPVGAEE